MQGSYIKHTCKEVNIHDTPLVNDTSCKIRIYSCPVNKVLTSQFVWCCTVDMCNRVLMIFKMINIPADYEISSVIRYLKAMNFQLTKNQRQTTEVV